MTKNIISSSRSIRIISGILRNSRLAVPDIVGLRPTPDRVRETLFNWLAPFIEGTTVLDLFAGTGALGIEALSRGAAHGMFVECDRKLAELLKTNLARLKIDPVEVLTQEANNFLQKTEKPFDIVFLDPPFAKNLWDATANLLETRGWLKDTAWIYVESPADILLNFPENWRLYRTGHAGAVRFALYHREAKLR